MVVSAGDARLPRFLRRDAGAEVERLYRRYSADVLRYAGLVLRSRTDAEDITQAVFLRALRAIERGEQVRSPRNWLIKIAHNECRRLLGSRKIHAELPEQLAAEPHVPGRAAELRAALEALPSAQRQALVLRELEGRSYAEIAASLDLSTSAVETLIFRARRTVREQLESSLSCEEFAVLLEDPAARSRVRAHARVCADCATLERQARGRKAALKRIASALGLPWWGAKVGAVALTTATVATVAVASPPHRAHHAPALARPAPVLRSVSHAAVIRRPASLHAAVTRRSPHPTVSARRGVSHSILTPRSGTSHLTLIPRSGTAVKTTAKSFSHPTRPVVAPPAASGTPTVVSAAPPAADPAPRDPQPAPAVKSAPAPAAAPLPSLPLPAPPVQLPALPEPPPAAVPSVPVPAVSVPLPAPVPVSAVTVPAVTVPVPPPPVLPTFP
jgi:RNA polymerase sigma factor (sigma-70 family)